MRWDSIPRLCSDALRIQVKSKKDISNMGFLDKAELPVDKSLNFIEAGEATIALVSLEKKKDKKGLERYEARFLDMSGPQKGQIVVRFFNVNNPLYEYGPMDAGLLMQLVGALHYTTDPVEIKKLAATDALLGAQQPARGLICNARTTKDRNKAGEVKLDKNDNPYTTTRYSLFGDVQLAPDKITASRKAVEAHKDFKGAATPDVPAVPETSPADDALAALGI